VARRAPGPLHFRKAHGPLADRKNIESPGRQDAPQNFRGRFRFRAHDLRRDRLDARRHPCNRLTPSQDLERGGPHRMPAAWTVRSQPGCSRNDRSVLARACKNSRRQENGAPPIICRILISRISREFEIWQAHALVHDLIGADTCGRFESFCAAAGHIIVLVHAVAADSESANERAVSK